jgi:hypothetical protein
MPRVPDLLPLQANLKMGKIKLEECELGQVRRERTFTSTRREKND